MARHLWCLFLATVAANAPSALAQERTASMDAIRRELAPGDSITLVRDGGERLSGRLLRIGESDLEIRPRGSQRQAGLTIPLDAIQLLERRRDPVGDGALIGAAVGAGLAATMFGIALAIDRNEVDEWAGPYLGAGAIVTGLGAALGAVIDSALSKRPLRFDRIPGGQPVIRVGALVSGGRGVWVTIAF